MNSESRILAANIRLKSTRGIRNGLQEENGEDNYAPGRKNPQGSFRPAENKSFQADKKSPGLVES